MFIIVGLVAVIAIIVTVVLILNANSSSTAPTDGVDPFWFLVSFGATFALAALFLFGLWLVRFLIRQSQRRRLRVTADWARSHGWFVHVPSDLQQRVFPTLVKWKANYAKTLRTAR